MTNLNKMYKDFKEWKASAPKNFVCFWAWNLWAWSEPYHYYLYSDILPIIGEYRIDDNGILHCQSVMGGQDEFPYGTYIVCTDRKVAARYRDDIIRLRDEVSYPQMPEIYTLMSKSKVLIQYANAMTN